MAPGPQATRWSILSNMDVSSPQKDPEPRNCWLKAEKIATHTHFPTIHPSFLSLFCSHVLVFLSALSSPHHRHHVLRRSSIYPKFHRDIPCLKRSPVDFFFFLKEYLLWCSRTYRHPPTKILKTGSPSRLFFSTPPPPPPPHISVAEKMPPSSPLSLIHSLHPLHYRLHGLSSVLTGTSAFPISSSLLTSRSASKLCFLQFVFHGQHESPQDQFDSVIQSSPILS